MSKDLEEFGYCLVADALPGPELRLLQNAIDRASSEDFQRGTAFLDTNGANQRLWQLLNRGEEFVALAQNPLVLDLASEVLAGGAVDGVEPDGLPSFLLSSLTGNIAGPGGFPMLLHADQAYIREPWPDYPIVCNGAWLLDDFTEANGATLVVPGTHKHCRNPVPGDERDAIPVEGPAGTLFFFDGRLWHGTGANRTDRLRRVALTYFCQPWIRTQENHCASLDEEFPCQRVTHITPIDGS